MPKNVGHGKNFLDTQMTARTFCPVQNSVQNNFGQERNLSDKGQKAKFLNEKSISALNKIINKICIMDLIQIYFEQ